MIMKEVHPIIKKLQFKDHGQPVLVLNAPRSYKEIIESFAGRVDTEIAEEQYDFIQVFGTSNEQIRKAAVPAVGRLADNGLLWLCYPKKSSKTYKGSDCSRETVGAMLADIGFEPVRQIAIDEDWSALRFRKPEQIKKMVRDFAYTEEGKARTKKE